MQMCQWLRLVAVMLLASHVNPFAAVSVHHQHLSRDPKSLTQNVLSDLLQPKPGPFPADSYPSSAQGHSEDAKNDAGVHERRSQTPPFSRHAPALEGPSALFSVSRHAVPSPVSKVKSAVAATGANAPGAYYQQPKLNSMYSAPLVRPAYMPYQPINRYQPTTFYQPTNLYQRTNPYQPTNLYQPTFRYPPRILAIRYPPRIPAIRYPPRIPAIRYPSTIPAVNYPSHIPAVHYPAAVPDVDYSAAVPYEAAVHIQEPVTYVPVNAPGDPHLPADARMEVTVENLLMASEMHSLEVHEQTDAIRSLYAFVQDMKTDLHDVKNSQKETGNTESVMKQITETVKLLRTITDHHDKGDNAAAKKTRGGENSIDQLQEQIRQLQKQVNDLQQLVNELQKQLQSQTSSTPEESASTDSSQTPDNQANSAAVAFTVESREEETMQSGDKGALKFNHVITNIGNGYNSTTGRFTAPRAGAYLFQASFCLGGNDPATVSLGIYNSSNDTASLVVLTGGQTKTGVVNTHLHQNEQVYVRNSCGEVLKAGGCASFTGILVTPTTE